MCESFFLRLSMDAANLMPAVDSDEDDELAELNRPRTLRRRDSAHLVGREHPFSPMVNRLTRSLSLSLFLPSLSPSSVEGCLVICVAEQGDVVQSCEEGL